MLHFLLATEIGACSKTSASDFFLTKYATMNTLSKEGTLPAYTYWNQEEKSVRIEMHLTTNKIRDIILP